MNSWVSTPKAIEFRSELGFKQHDIILTKEQSVISKITKLFAKEKILLQHSIFNYKIDLYFPKHKLAIEVDEKGHTDWDGKKRRMKEKKKLVANLLESNRIKKIMMSMLNLVKYTITLINQPKH